MSISNTQARVSYNGNGTTTAFSVPFPFLANGDLVVIEQNLISGTQTTKVLTTDYTVSGAGDPSGGAVTANSAPSASVSWVIYRDPALTQNVDIVDGDPLPAASIETPLDKLTMIVQRLSDRLDRTVHQPDGDSLPMAVLPPKQVRLNTLMAFDSNGDPTVGPTGSDISSAQGYAVAAAASATAAAASAADALAVQSKIPDPSVGNALKFIRVKSDGSAYEAVTVSGSGTVTGPVSSTSRAIALYGDTTGTVIKDGPALGTSGQVLVSGGASADPAFGAMSGANLSANTVPLSALSRVGTSGQVLTSQGAGADPIYATPSGGSGEANTSSNQGTGAGWALAKSGVNLPFRSFKLNVTQTGGGVQVTDVTASITTNTNDLTLNITVTKATCFPAGSIVTMADGSFKPIELVQVGEFVLGRYGEVNEVLALDRPLLGDRQLWSVNGEHWTTNEHPHWTEAGPMAISPRALKGDWGAEHAVILADGSTDHWLNVGLMRPVGVLERGAMALYHGRTKEIRTLYAFDVSRPTLQLYNLVLAGSHTMRVDGYLVTGWPREDDFDYDAWEPIGA